MVVPKDASNVVHRDEHVTHLEETTSSQTHKASLTSRIPSDSDDVIVSHDSTRKRSIDREDKTATPSQELEMVIDALRRTVLQNNASNAANRSSQVFKTLRHSEEELRAPSDYTPEYGSSNNSEYHFEPQTLEKDGVDQDDLAPPSPGTPPLSTYASEMPGRPSEDVVNMETHSANLIALHGIDLKAIKPNTLLPREQEKADEPVLRAVRHLFNNRFMKAKNIFEKQAKTDPLYALGLGSMAFLKAIMIGEDNATDNAIDVLTATYSLAAAQIDVATKRSVGDSVTQAFSSYYQYIKSSRGSGLPSGPKPVTRQTIEKQNITFVPNGVLRAHVAKAECCLEMAILQLLQESVVGYIKCGVNLRRAYTSYSLVWQEYKRMGQTFNDYIDQDTVSGIQFGIGAVHLLLSSLPQKILNIVSAFGWKADKHLGFALLKLCLEGRRVRSPMASLMLLAYYTVLTSLCPQILANEYTQPAIETLLDAQRTYPNSAFFLYFAGQTSRLARNLTLSTQSFQYGIEISKNEWAEVEVMHLCSYEIAFNYMIQHNWEEAAKLLDMLFKGRYWSPAIFRYLYGACLEMLGQRTDAILVFAEVPELVGSKTTKTAAMEQYVLRKVNSFEASGYQDMGMTLCALEYLCIFNAFEFMDESLLEKSVSVADAALNRIMEAERAEYGIRTRELLPETPPPKYFDQRGALLLIKASLQNALGRHRDAIVHLNWIIDHKNEINVDKWVVPFAFWQAGITSWGLGNKTRARLFWETALRYTKYDFEYRLAMMVNLAITRADDLGIPKPETKTKKTSSTRTDRPEAKASSTTAH